MTRHPKLALCNFLDNPQRLRSFALQHGFDGVDWSFTKDNLPWTREEIDSLLETISVLAPLEVRYHCFLKDADIGAVCERDSIHATAVLRHLCSLVSLLGGKVVTVHIGLGDRSPAALSWEKTIERLRDLVLFADRLGISLCLENLPLGWTSRPTLFEKLLRKSGCWGTLDIGHARVSPSVSSQWHDIADFVAPHPQRFLNAHIYHEENEHGHVPPKDVTDLEERLSLLARLSSCDWWVLELREEKALLKTLRTVRQFLNGTLAASRA